MRKQKKQKKSNYKFVLAIVLIALIIVAVVLIVKNNKNEKNNNNVQNYETMVDGTKFNNSESLKQTKTFGQYELSNADLQERDGEVQFSAKIKNISDKATESKSIYIVFKSQSGEDIYKMQTYLTEIQPGSSMNINSKITKDVINAYTIEIQQ